MLCSDVVAQVNMTLNDPNNTLFTETQKITALNDALLALVAVRPDAAATTAVRLLAAGTQQTIPDDGVALIRVIRNAGESGLSATGRAIRRVDADTLDAVMPTWHSATGQAEVREYTYDARSPREFYVNPPATGTPTIGVLLTYVKPPAAVSASSETFPVDDRFAPAVQAFMLYRLWGGDDESSPNYQAAQSQFSAFQTLLGLRASGDNMLFGGKA